MRNSLIGLAIIAALATGGFIFYKKVYIPKSTYNYIVPEKGSIAHTVFGIGTVDAKDIYPLGSNFGGKLLKVYKDQGEWVKKGERVAVLDPVDLYEQLAGAKAAYKKAELEIGAAVSELETLQAQLRLAKLTFERYSKLYEQKYAAQAEYDKAKSDLEVLLARIASAKSQIEASKAERERAKSTIDALRQKIARLEVKSPLDGYVIERSAIAGQNVAPQQPIVTIADPKTVWVRVYIDERESGRIEVGNRAKIRLRSHPEKEFGGKVARVEAKSDPVTQERTIDVAFDKIPIPFYLNEQAEATIETGEIEGALLIPDNTVVNGGVWVYRDGKAHFVKVKILARDDRKIAVEGVEPDSKILVPDLHKKPLKEGTDINI